MELNRRSFLESATAAGIALCMPGCATSASARPGGVWKGWKKGRFQAHFIYTGVAESIFLVYPDSTTVMIDCGDHAMDSLRIAVCIFLKDIKDRLLIIPYNVPCS